MLKMVDGTGIIGVDMICPLGVSTPQPPNYDRVELEGAGMLVLPNSLDAPLERLELGGKTGQVQTSGKQLFDAKNAELNKWVGSTGIIATVGRNCIFRLNVKPNTVYQVNILSASSTFSFSQFSKENVFLERTVFSKGTKSFKCTTTEDVDYAYFLIGDTVDNINGIINDVMLYEGEEYKNYEPYTGGKPSPSPEYPQEIKNVGKWNEGTQKYEVDVKVSNCGYLQKGSYANKIRPLPLEKGKTYRIYVDVKSAVVNVGILNEERTFANSGQLYAYYNSRGYPISSTGVVSGICRLPNSLYRGYTFTVTVDGLFLYQGVNANILNTDNAYVAYDFIKKVDISSPYTEKESVVLTSDRPITKWDKLVEQGGQIGWLYKSKIESIPKTGWVLHAQGYFYRGGLFLDSVVNNVPKNEVNLFTHFRLGNPTIAENKDVAWLCVVALGNTSLRVRLADETITTASAFEKYIADKDIKIAYETTNPEFVPLPQSEQNAIRALKAYYPTTVITADGGELDPDIKVTYRKEI